MNNKEKQKIKNYFLITQGLDIQEVIEFHKFLLLPPHGTIEKDKPYQDQEISTWLNLISYQIKDISPLQNLTNLDYLELSCNKIKDITTLQNLTNLTCLNLNDTNSKDITPLQNLLKLTELNLRNNYIEDISPLQNLTKLIHLTISNNKIPKSQIEDLKKALPNCEIYHDFE